jgi:hypothetical protein
MSDFDLSFAKTGTTAETASAASAGSFPILLPLRKSSCVALATYSPFDGVLQVTLQSGDVITYQNLGLVTVLKWLDASSVGGYFNSAIRGQ